MLLKPSTQLRTLCARHNPGDSSFAVRLVDPNSRGSHTTPVALTWRPPFSCSDLRLQTATVRPEETTQPVPLHPENDFCFVSAHTPSHTRTHTPQRTHVLIKALRLRSEVSPTCNQLLLFCYCMFIWCILKQCLELRIQHPGRTNNIIW